MAVVVTTTRNVKKTFKDADSFKIDEGVLVVLKAVNPVAAFATWQDVEVTED